MGCSRLVHVGSSLEYGSKASPMSEDDRLAPTVPRGAAKAASTLVCLAWSRALEVPTLVLRPFSVYGPWEDANRLVPAAFRAALEGAELPLTGAGIVHDFVYVGDVVDAILCGLTAPRTADGQVVNIGSGIETSNEELVATVGRVARRDISVLPGQYPLRRHDSGTWVADVERARDVLAWTASMGLEEGLGHTLTWLGTRMSAVSS
jgi:nucleoside-diphosphate-sugar epimerase